MKRLQSYSKNGYRFEILQRVGDFAVFGGTSDQVFKPTFEVIEIQSHDGRLIGSTDYPPAEYPPSNSQWGTKGWTMTTFESAMEKLKELIETNQ